MAPGIENLSERSTPVGAGRKASVVRAGRAYRAEQGSHYAPGVSAETVGSEALWLGIVTLAPGQRTKAHVHARHETAFYHMGGGQIELWSGDELEYREIVRPGDYLFIPPNVLHVAVNVGEEAATLIGSRNEPTAQDSVILRPEMDARVP
jgi:uncharacterized RmlC-like cupin family protein